jgi:hypothetical protein
MEEITYNLLKTKEITFKKHYTHIYEIKEKYDKLIRIIEHLIKSGASLKSKNKHGYTPLYISIFSEYSKIDLTIILLDNNAEYEKSILSECIAQNKIEHAILLISRRFELEDSYRLFSLALIFQKLIIFENLLKFGYKFNYDLIEQIEKIKNCEKYLFILKYSHLYFNFVHDFLFFNFYNFDLLLIFNHKNYFF